MAVSGVSAIQSTYYTAAASAGGQAASAASDVAGGDSIELSSSASGSGGSTSSTCPRSNSRCIGCGSCETASSNSADESNSLLQPVKYAALQALSAYESASKYV